MATGIASLYTAPKALAMLRKAYKLTERRAKTIQESDDRLDTS